VLIRGFAENPLESHHSWSNPWQARPWPRALDLGQYAAIVVEADERVAEGVAEGGVELVARDHEDRAEPLGLAAIHDGSAGAGEPHVVVGKPDDRGTAPLAVEEVALLVLGIDRDRREGRLPRRRQGHELTEQAAEEKIGDQHGPHVRAGRRMAEDRLGASERQVGQERDAAGCSEGEGTVRVGEQHPTLIRGLGPAEPWKGERGESRLRPVGKAHDGVAGVRPGTPVENRHLVRLGRSLADQKAQPGGRAG
jgi:hypothetical protein